jgi:GNAT superfamily N-acetyltransferase
VARGLFGRDLTHQDIQNLTAVHHLDVPGAHTTELELAPHGSDGLSYAARIKDAEGKTLVEVKRQIETNWESGKREVEIHHDLMTVAEHLQGEGLGSKIFDAQLKAYQACGGIDRITTDAAWVGMYQWPAVGFGLAHDGVLDGGTGVALTVIAATSCGKQNPSCQS